MRRPEGIRLLAAARRSPGSGVPPSVHWHSPGKGAATASAKLAVEPRLRAVVGAKLALRWSPEQIASWLPLAYPQDPVMRVSHETIYLSLFVQGRDALRRELQRCLRTGRAMRRLRDTLHISQRPAEAADRAVPGHWEGDLVFGRRPSAVGTLVERRGRYVLLFPLPRGLLLNACGRH